MRGVEVILVSVAFAAIAGMLVDQLTLGRIGGGAVASAIVASVLATYLTWSAHA